MQLKASSIAETVNGSAPLIVGISNGNSVDLAIHNDELRTQLAKPLLELIHSVIESGDFQGQKNHCQLLLNNERKVLLVGLGKAPLIDAKSIAQAQQAAYKALSKTQIEQATSLLFFALPEAQQTAANARCIASAAKTASYNYHHSFSQAAKTPALRCINQTLPEELLAQAEQASAMAEGVNLARELGNLPGNICTPSYLAEQAQALDKQYERLTTTVLEEADMQKLGMGALLAVSNGSRQPAKLITMEYKGGSAKQKPVVLVGKGLTFDAGGISIKPGAGMDEMKYDMCGAASVFGTLLAACQMQLPLNIVGVVPSSENLPDGMAVKPGDVVTSMAGKTIEILNTDAEGRLILCDALEYSRRFDPEVVVDMATLTGACIIALGHHISGLLGNDDALCDELLTAGTQASDPAWRLPINADYQAQLKSNFADMANIGGRPAGTITAACFLARFTEDYRWAHLDIAGTAWKSGAQKGATGRPVPLLTEFLLNRVG